MLVYVKSNTPFFYMLYAYSVKSLYGTEPEESFWMKIWKSFFLLLSLILFHLLHWGTCMTLFGHKLHFDQIKLCRSHSVHKHAPFVGFNCTQTVLIYWQYSKHSTPAPVTKGYPTAEPIKVGTHSHTITFHY